MYVDWSISHDISSPVGSLPAVFSTSVSVPSFIKSSVSQLVLCHNRNSNFGLFLKFLEVDIIKQKYDDKEFASTVVLFLSGLGNSYICTILAFPKSMDNVRFCKFNSH